MTTDKLGVYSVICRSENVSMTVMQFYAFMKGRGKECDGVTRPAWLWLGKVTRFQIQSLRPITLNIHVQGFEQDQDCQEKKKKIWCIYLMRFCLPCLFVAKSWYDMFFSQGKTALQL